jgi:hypothetical protein
MAKARASHTKHPALEELARIQVQSLPNHEEPRRKMTQLGTIGVSAVLADAADMMFKSGK